METYSTANYFDISRIMEQAFANLLFLQTKFDKYEKITAIYSTFFDVMDFYERTNRFRTKIELCFSRHANGRLFAFAKW